MPLVQGSVANYLLNRALEINCSAAEAANVKVEDMKELDVYRVFTADDEAIVATWQPYVGQLSKLPEVKRIFDSSQIPYEILDVLFVDTKTLRRRPELGHALVGAWFEVIELLHREDMDGRHARRELGELIGISADDMVQHMSTTAFFRSPMASRLFMESDALTDVIKRYEHFGYQIGVVDSPFFTNTTRAVVLPKITLGDPSNVLLRIDPAWLKAHEQKYPAGFSEMGGGHVDD